MNSPASFLRAVLGAFAIASTAACAGHASGALPSGSASTSHRAQDAASTIKGVIKTEKYVVAAGKTVKVDGKLTIFATGSIEIAGTLEIPRGTEVAFFTPQFTVTGGITSAPALGDANVPPYAIDSIDACSLSVSNNGRVEIPAGDTLAMASTEADCDLTVDSYTGIRVDPAPMPSPLPGGQAVNGPNGGNIAIGIQAALTVIKQRAGSEPFGAFAPRDVNLGAPLIAGTAAAGSSGKTRYANATCFFDAGGNGGRGGSVSISAQRIKQVISTAQIIAGGGGDGGGSGFDLTICHTGGTPAIPRGAGVVAVESSGGDGGNIVIDTSMPSKIGTQTAGNGGAAGFTTGLNSAPSYCKMPPCSASLSDVELRIGKVGAHGTGGHTKVADGAYPAFTAQALGGEPSTGPGANFTLVYPVDMKPPLKGLTIVMMAFGIVTGTAPSSCGSPGAKGANGGTLHDDGAISSFKIDPYLPPAGIKSFSGGIGGNGTPAGSGGIGGFDDEHHKIGSNGAKGTLC
jgi:hypothetical protein